MGRSGGGRGIAGVSAVKTVVQHDGKQSVLLINGESVSPYKRTKLSKLIAEGFSPSKFLLESDDWCIESGVALKSGVTVEHLDPETRRLELSDDTELGFDRLILATGSELLFPKTVRAHEAGSFCVAVRR